MGKYLDIALKAVKAADKVTLAYFGKKPRTRLKADMSPVTVADMKAERAIIETIRRAFPGHDFYGEEYGRTGARSEYLWIIDPIDGTKNFIGGIPLWGTLIALMHRNELIVGVSHLPLMGETLWAERGKGAFFNGKKVRVSKIDSLDNAMISFGSPGTFRKIGKDVALMSLVYACKRQRAFGDQWPYHLLATGRLEIALEYRIKPMDVAPLALIIKEAGGVATDLEGRPFNLNINSFLATNGKLHQAALGYFK